MQIILHIALWKYINGIIMKQNSIHYFACLLEIPQNLTEESSTYGPKYSRVDQVKFVEDRFYLKQILQKKNFTWSILEYFAPYVNHGNSEN